MIRRARLLVVILTLAAGGLGIISSTQTWLTVVLEDGVHHALQVPGADAIPVLAPLSLAVLALGAALSIVGLIVRYVFGALSVAIAVILLLLTGEVVAAPSTRHVAATVTTATGITGDASVTALVAGISTSAWPATTLVAWIVLLGAALLTLATAHRWKGTGRRFTTTAAAAAPAGGGQVGTGPGSRPHDAIDDWDDLSRGEDPTA